MRGLGAEPRRRPRCVVAYSECLRLRAVFVQSMWIIRLTATALLLSSCVIKDEKAEFDSIDTLAVGAYVPMSFGDACAASGKISPCTSESIESELELRVDDPAIARIVPRDEWPEDGEPRVGQFLVQGVSPGTTRIHGRARFSDGSVRRASRKLSVAQPDRLALVVSCFGMVEASTRVRPGQEVEFELVPMLGDEWLAGRFADAVDNEDVVCETKPAAFNAPECRWQAPGEGGEIVLRTAHDPDFHETIATYGPDDVTEVVTGQSQTPWRFGSEDVFSLNAQVLIEGQRPCRNMPAQVKTLTPEVCSGPEGQAAWFGDESGVEIKALADGTCKLALGAKGASRYPSETSLPIVVVSALTTEQAAARGGVCSSEGASTCAHGFRDVLTCSQNRWALDRSCGERACEMRVNGEDGCDRPEGCADCRP